VSGQAPTEAALRQQVHAKWGREMLAGSVEDLIQTLAEDPSTVEYLRAVAAESVAQRDVVAALEWFASDEAWTVTPQSQTDNRFQFTAPPGSVYATPWGYAKSVLKSVAAVVSRTPGGGGIS
jgi:hypothetical protein